MKNTMIGKDPLVDSRDGLGLHVWVPDAKFPESRSTLVSGFECNVFKHALLSFMPSLKWKWYWPIRPVDHTFP